MNVLEAVLNFNLELLPWGWVEEVWTSDNSGDFDTPVEYGDQADIEYYDIILSTIDAIKFWLSCDSPCSSDSPKKSWRILQDLGLDHRPLVCLISTFMKAEYNDIESRILGLVASRLYVNMLSIPGAMALNIYNGNIFYKALCTLKLPKMSDVMNDRNKKLPKKKIKQNSVESSPSLSPSEPELSGSDRNRILYEAGQVLCDLCICLNELRLNCDFGALTEVIRVMVELTRTEKYINVILSSCNKNSTGFVAKKAYDVLYQLCDEEQGELKCIVLYLMSHLLHNLSGNEEDMKIGLFEQNTIKNHTLSFIEKLLTIHNQDVEDGIVALFQKLCRTLPDREEMRSKCVPDLVSYIRILPPNIFHDCILWLISLMHSPTLKERIAGADVVAGILNIADKISDSVLHQETAGESGNENESSLVKLMYRTIFTAYISTSCDISPLVRSKCLNVLSKLVLSKQSEMKSIINNIFVLNFEDDNSQLTNPEGCLFDFASFFNKGPKGYPQHPLPSGKGLINLIERLSKDERVNVKRNACHLLSNICLLNEQCVQKKILSIFVERCKDTYISVRKSAADCLTELVLRYQNNEEIMTAWVDGVLPLVVDIESSSSDKAVQHLKTVVFDKVRTYNGDSSPESTLPWKVLYIIAKKEKRTLFSNACCLWSKQGTVSDRFIGVLESHIGTENNSEVWFMIVCLSQFITIRHSDFIYNYYFENMFSAKKVEEYLCLLVLEALYLNWRSLRSRNQSEMFLKFKLAIEKFDVSFPLIARYMDYCFQYKSSETKEWSGTLIKKCEAYLHQCISPGATKQFGENQMCQYIFTLGEAAHFHPGVNPILLEYLANLIDPSFIEGQKWTGRKIPNRMKGVAIITLGKICLQDQFTAKTYAPLLGRVLTNSSSAVTLKINSMIALSDLCKRFTSVVEDYFGDMCVPLRDQDVNVRKNTLCHLIELIQEDFLKVKSPLIFYLLIMLLDLSSDIREMIDAFFVNSIKKKTPNIMCQNFIQSILFFNNFEGHKKYTIDGVSHVEKIVFSLAGVNNFSQRGRLYRYMLNHMKDDERFLLSNRLCTDIMALVCDGTIPLDVRGTAVLKDALSAMSCKEMRLEHLRKPNSNNNNIERDPEDPFFHLAQHAFLNSIVKANYIETIVPILTRLRQKLMEVKSPLQKDTMICFRELMRDYREEVNEIFDDLILATEIELDLRNLNVEDDKEEELPEEEVIKSKVLKIHCERLTKEVLLQRFGMDEDNLPPELPSDSQSPRGSTSGDPQGSGANTPLKRQGRAQSSFTSPLSPYANPTPGPSSRVDTPVRRQSESELHNRRQIDSPPEINIDSPATSPTSQLSDSSGRTKRRRNKKSNLTSQLTPLMEYEPLSTEPKYDFSDSSTPPLSVSLMSNCVTAPEEVPLTKRRRRRRRSGSASSSISAASTIIEPPELSMD